VCSPARRRHGRVAAVPVQPGVGHRGAGLGGWAIDRFGADEVQARRRVTMTVAGILTWPDSDPAE
jgi:hypothetical protein